MGLYDAYQEFIRTHPRKSFHHRGDVIIFRQFGEGPKVLVLLLGNAMFSGDAYFKLQEGLAQEYQIITIDDYGAKMTIDKVTDCISDLLKVLEIKKVWVMGMSHGGGLALSFARDHASQCEGLILYNTLMRPKEESDISNEVVQNVLAAIDQLSELRRIMPLAKIKEVLIEQIKEEIKDEDAIDLFEALISQYTEAHERSQMSMIRDLLSSYLFSKADFKYLNYKSLIFYGHDPDPFGGNELIEALVDTMTNPHLQYLETNRFDLIVHPDEMLEKMIKFINSLNKKALN